MGRRPLIVLLALVAASASLASTAGALRASTLSASFVKIEAMLGSRPLYEHFRLVLGTSTGAIIAALIALGYSIKEIHDLYSKHVPGVMQLESPSENRRRSQSWRTRSVEIASSMPSRPASESLLRNGLSSDP